MKILSAPITRTFNLQSDPDGLAAVTIRQATFAEDRERQELFAKIRMIFDDERRGQIVQENSPSTGEIMQLEIALTLAGAEGIEDEEGNPIFHFKEHAGVSRVAERGQFYRALGRLPGEAVREIWGYVREVNPQFRGAAVEGE